MPFLKRTQLNSRLVAPSRRSKRDKEEVTEFVSNFHISFAISRSATFMHFDESNWKLAVRENRPCKRSPNIVQPLANRLQTVDSEQTFDAVEILV
jgi:hypothetical protein